MNEIEPILDHIIPHRSRMKLVDRLVEINCNHAVAEARVTRQWPMYAQGGVSSLTAIELVAQTSAGVFANKLSFTMKQEEIFGYIAGIKSARFHQPVIPEKTDLTIRSQNDHFLDSDGALYGVFDGQVVTGNDILADISLQILRPRIENSAEFDARFSQTAPSVQADWDENWQAVQDIRTGENGVITALSKIPTNSAWFDGHFPGRPLLPGVAIIGQVAQMLIQHQEAQGTRVQVTGIKKVKFKDLVLPGQTLTISALPTAKKDSRRFEVTRDETVVCGGVIQTTES